MVIPFSPTFFLPFSCPLQRIRHRRRRPSCAVVLVEDLEPQRHLAPRSYERKCHPKAWPVPERVWDQREHWFDLGHFRPLTAFAIP